MKKLHVLGLSFALVFSGLAAPPAASQMAVNDDRIDATAMRRSVIVPQGRHLGPQSWRVIEVSHVDADVVINGQVATTTLEIVMRNLTGAVQEAEVVLPVPEGASLVGFSIDGPGTGFEAQLMERAEATRIYEGIVRTMRDPGLLEFVGYNMIKSSVFPVQANGERRARIVYEQLLDRTGERIDYALPRSDGGADTGGAMAPWSIDVRLIARAGISTIYSPSHAITRSRNARGAYEISVAAHDAQAPGAFRLSYVLAADHGVAPTVMMYPALEGEAGYFLMLAGTPEELSSVAAARGAAREITLVIDRSGSMGGVKLAQALESARQVIHGLRPGERFNILAYSDTVERFSMDAVEKNNATVAQAIEYLEGVTAQGGTNLHAALGAALRQSPAPGTLPLVIFLTDGLPTVGDTAETSIRALATNANPHERRVFTFGVGHDVNGPLLTAIADDSRGAATFVHPGEDVEARVGEVFAKLHGPVLASPQLFVMRDEIRRGPNVPRTIFDVIPGAGEIPDLFTGDQLVIVGRYHHAGELTLRGSFLGAPMSFSTALDPSLARTSNSFIPRLWANRKIATLIDSVRRLGADPSIGQDDPRLKELTDEIVRLSLKHGVMTEYTAFLAREDVAFARAEEAVEFAQDAMHRRAVRTRGGAGGVSQSMNTMALREMDSVSESNRFVNDDLDEVSIFGVQQAADRSIFRRGGRWIDGSLADEPGEIEADREIAFGSRAHLDLASRFFREGRQALLAQSGDILLTVDGERVLIRAAADEREQAE